MSKSIDKDHTGHNISQLDKRRWYEGKQVSHSRYFTCHDCNSDISYENLTHLIGKEIQEIQEQAIPQKKEFKKKMRHFVVPDHTANKCGECNKIFKLNENTNKCLFCKVRVHGGNCSDSHNKKLVNEDVKSK